MSALGLGRVSHSQGHLQTFDESKPMSALPPESGHQNRAPPCLLRADFVAKVD